MSALEGARPANSAAELKRILLAEAVRRIGAFRAIVNDPPPDRSGYARSEGPVVELI